MLRPSSCTHDEYHPKPLGVSDYEYLNLNWQVYTDLPGKEAEWSREKVVEGTTCDEQRKQRWNQANYLCSCCLRN